MSKRIFAGIVVLVGLSVVGCGGDDNNTAADPVATCKQIASTICSKAYNCYSDAELKLAAAFIGNNQADCVTKWEGKDQLNCTTEGTKCDSGETYHSDKASECMQQYEGFSCSEFKGLATGTTVKPAACDQICM
jgi:hypothetical protein